MLDNYKMMTDFTERILKQPSHRNGLSHFSEGPLFQMLKNVT